MSQGLESLTTSACASEAGSGAIAPSALLSNDIYGYLTDKGGLYPEIPFFMVN